MNILNALYRFRRASRTSLHTHNVRDPAEKDKEAANGDKRLKKDSDSIAIIKYIADLLLKFTLGNWETKKGT